jgi:hypothetical protein
MIAQVTPREHDVLTLARALVGEVPRGLVLPLLGRRLQLPAKMGATAARLLRDTLAVGCVRALMRRGGARRGAILDGDRVVRGRAWERTPPLPLAFSALTARLVRWLASEPLARPEIVEDLPASEPTIADEIALYLMRDLLAPDLLAPLLRQPVVARSALLALAFPAHVDPARVPAFGPWLDGGGAVLVAALAPDLARHWAALARRTAEGATVCADAQDAVASAFLDACDARGRRDLASFVVDAGRAILGTALVTGQRVADHLVPRPPPGATLAARAAARTAAGAPLRALLRVGRWQEQHRLVRHFDDDYAAAQHLLARWEPNAPLFPLAERALRELDALDAVVGTA